MKDFFKSGGIFLFDENDSQSESSFYKLEDFMSEEEGQDITDTYIDDSEEISIFYDSSILSEEQAVKKYNDGIFSKYLK